MQTSSLPLMVWINATLENKHLLVDVKNSGKWISDDSRIGKEGTGTGLQNIKKRLSQHKSDSNRFNYVISRAIKKYGLDNFNIYVFECDECDLDYFERGFIKQMNSLVPNGYNLTTGGNKKKHLSDETKNKIVLSKTGKHCGKDNYWYGKKFSYEHRKKISLSHIGLMVGEKHPWYGRRHSEETKTKMRMNHADFSGVKSPCYGRRASAESRKKMSASHIGIQFGGKHPRAKKIICVETGEIFNSISCARRKYNNSSIAQCVAGKSKTACGYRWEYYNG